MLCKSKWLQPVTHDVVHHIFTTGRQIASKLRKHDGEKLYAVKAEFKQFRHLNLVTEPDVYPLPDMFGLH